MRIGLVIPARDEESCIGSVVADCLAHCPPGDDIRVVVCDNGSVDLTASVARQAGAEVVHEPQRGYGAACLRAIEHLSDWPDVVVFVDGDGASDLAGLPQLLQPLKSELGKCPQAELVIGWRCFVEAGSMGLAQRLGNWWFCSLVRWRWGQGSWGERFRDMGPFRAITRQALEKLDMQDRTWGWTLEMQIKAVLAGLRVAEVPVTWRRRRFGSSKISGTLLGVLRAGYKISVTFCRFAIRRRQAAAPPRGDSVPDVVIAFTKYPRPGLVKTRLAAGIGEQRAADVYRRLAQGCYRQLMILQNRKLADVVVYAKGRSLRAFERWLPGARSYWPQPQGGLTECLQQAFARAFAQGSDSVPWRRVAVVGTDSPTLSAEMMADALGRLQSSDVVIIPNDDGGYALIALKQHCPQLFENIEWSTSAVLDHTQCRAQELGLSVSLLPAIPDVDTADDLIHIRPLLSVIMPVLNEEKVLRKNLTALQEVISSQSEEIEVLVVDGGSTDNTRKIALECGAVALHSAKGRARQMNVGTAKAKGEWLWYVHADCTVTDAALGELIERLRDAHIRDWGYFQARIDAPGGALRLIECGINLRSRWLGLGILSLPYGDQGLFVHRNTMQYLGGFNEYPLLEDVDLVVRLNRLGRPIRVRCPLLIDARRWRQYGAWRTTVTNWRIMFDYFVGRKDINDIAGHYDKEIELGTSSDAKLREGAIG